MPALVAADFNAELKSKHQALVTAAKPVRVALTAYMRKLPILATSLQMNARPWTPKVA